MKKISMIAFSAICIGCSLLFTGCGDGAADASAKKVIRVATISTFPPYSFCQDGKITGIDIDILREIAENLGLPLEIKETKFTSLLLDVETGKCDVGAAGISVTEDRKRQINFTIPYATATQIVIVPQKSSIETPADLRRPRLRIGVPQGTTSDIYTSKFLCEPSRFENAEEALAALSEDKVDAVVCDGGPGRVYISKYPGLKILPIALANEEYAFAVGRQNVDLLRKFDAELQKMRNSGRLQQIHDSYLAPKQP